MDIRKVVIALVVFCGLCTISATAEVPHYINFQGMLTNSIGNPITGTRGLIFAIYQDSTGGSSLWNETHTAVLVTDGLFRVILGSIQPIPDSLFTGQVRWLETTVEGEILSPRTKIVTVPYSLKSGVADHAVYADSALQGNFWNLDGNSGTTSSTHFIGTQDNQAMELRVNSQRCVTWYPNATCPTLIGGYSGNTGTTGVAGAVISGGGMSGYANSVTDVFGTVGGGRGNQVGSNNANTWDNPDATVGGGISNTASKTAATVAGGSSNTASNNFSTVGGGYHNTASGWYSSIIGGKDNIANNGYAIVAGGANNLASNDGSTVGGGINNTASGYGSTVCGGTRSIASGQYSVVSGGGGPDADDINEALGDYSTLGGGNQNTANGDYSFVGGGWGNDAIGTSSIVSGGCSNNASGGAATISGGNDNNAEGEMSTVGGGYENAANGYASTVPGGYNNRALARYAFAAGKNAVANTIGSFVWADSSESSFYAGGHNSFSVRASGGIRMFTNANLDYGVTLTANDNTWNSVCDSTKKTVLHRVDSHDILERVAKLPITRWKFKDSDSKVEHISPMAQDFWNLFHVGSDSLKISTLDPDGIALAAIQELAKKVQEIDELKTRLAKLEALVQAQSNDIRTTMNDNSSYSSTVQLTTQKGNTP